MRVAYRLFILAFFFVVFSVLPQAALAANVTTLDVSAPSSVEKDEKFTVKAYYTSNGTNVCGATCELRGGWFSSTVYLAEVSGCIYENTEVSAYGSVGSYSPYVYCYRQYYDSKTEYFGIEITRKSSSLSVSFTPSSPYPGEILTVYAYYRDEDGYLIQDASCRAEIKKAGEYFNSVSLARSGNEYYSGTLFVPYEYGTYDVEVTCDSDEYDSEFSKKSFTTSKKKASLALSIPISGYYGEFLRGVAYYRDENGVKIDGVCTAHFDDRVLKLSSTVIGYELEISIPYKTGPHTLKVTCESNAYDTAESSLEISARNRPAKIEVISPVPRDFYPTDEIQLKISYLDAISNSKISGARCAAEIGGKSYPMGESGNYYEISIRNQSIGRQTIEFKCSKSFYEGAASTFPINVVKIPIDIMFMVKNTEFRSGEEIKIPAKVVDNKHNYADVTCRGRVDVFDLSFNRLINSRDIQPVKTSGGFSLDVPNPGEPSKIRVTMICSGEIFEERSAYTEVKIKMLGTQTEEGITLFLTVTTVILLALTFLIRKKLKII